MWRVPSDLDGLTLPRGVPLEAQSCVVALQRAAALCAQALETVDGSTALTTVWSGPAADAFRARRVGLSRRCADLESVTAAAGQTVQRWMPEAAADRAAMARAADAVREVQAREAAAAAAGRAYAPEITAAGDAAWQDWDGGKERYAYGVGRLTQALRALGDEVSDRPLGVGDHAQAFVARLWDDAVADPARTVWALTGAGLVDPRSWRRDVSALPGEVTDGVAAAAHDPRGLLSALVDGPAWRDGHIGEGAGAVAAVLVPTPHWLHLGPEHGLAMVGRRILDPRAPLPSLQTVDELLHAPDLLRQEHAALGHTLTRHVDVDDAFLMDRLRHGTVDEITGERTFTPKEASRFLDRAAAETSIGQALRANEGLVRAFAASRADLLEITYDTGHDVGVVLTPGPGDGHAAGFAVEHSSVVEIQLRRSSRGQVFVATAFVQRPS